MKYFFTISLSIIILSGCSNTRLIEQRYPDRVKYSFADPSTGLRNAYLCELIDSRKKTDTRAKIAHNFLSKRIKEISAASTQEMFDANGFSVWSAIKSSASLQRNAKVVATEVEEKFKCVLFAADE